MIIRGLRPPSLCENDDKAVCSPRHSLIPVDPSGRMVLADTSLMKILPWIALPLFYIGIVANHSLFYTSYWT